MAKVQRITTGTDFLQWLEKAGVLQEGLVRRVVIDATFNEALILYVEQYCDKPFINLDVPDGLANSVVVSAEMESEPEEGNNG